MDDLAHTDESSQIDLQGYQACRNQWCPSIMLDEIARKTKGLCPDCFTTHLGEQLSAVEAISKGERLHVKLGGRRRNNPKGDYDTKKQTERARNRALKRLRLVFPDLYDIFYAEERARVGLEPWTIESVLTPPTDPGAEQTLEFARVYHQLDEHGVDVNGTQDPSPDTHPPRR